MAGDVIASLGQGPRAVWTLPAEQQAATRRRVQLGVLCSVARSSCCQAFQHEDKDRRMLLELPDDGSVQLQAPDEFSLHLAFDLSRWSVLGASLAPQGLGSVLSVGKEGEQSLCRQLQAAADSQPPEAEGGDALAAICSAAQTFISHLWLRAMHDESLRLLAVPGISGQAEISSSFWDRRGFVLLRICPDWDATVGGLCVDIALPGGRSLTNAPRDFADLRGFASGRGSRAPGQDVAGFNGVVTSGGMSSSSSTSGCALELHSDAAGGIRPVSHPDLGLQPISPAALRSFGGSSAGLAACLEWLVGLTRHSLASHTLGRVHDALVLATATATTATAAATATIATTAATAAATTTTTIAAATPSNPNNPTNHFVFKNKQTTIAAATTTAGRAHGFSAGEVELLEGGPVLRVLLRGCAVYVLMHPGGRLAFSTAGWAEQRPRKAAGGQEGFVARLEASRWAGLESVAASELARNGWTSTSSGGEEEEEGKEQGQAEKEQDVVGKRRFTCHFRQQPLTLRFDLLDSEVCEVWLVGEGGSLITVPGLEPFDFAHAAGVDGGFVALRSGLRRVLAVAQEIVESANLGSQVLGSLERHAATLQVGESVATISAALGASGCFECKLSWHAPTLFGTSADVGGSLVRATPFEPPLQVRVDEVSGLWALTGKLRTAVQLVPSVQGAQADLLPCGGRLKVNKAETARPARSSSSGAVYAQELTVEFDAVALHSSSWRGWARDLAALALLTECAQQAQQLLELEPGAEPELLGLELELCRPACLKFRLPAAGGTEVFELVPAPLPRAAEKLSEGLLVCFRWMEARPCILASRWSRRLCRTRCLRTSLSTIAAAAELGCAVEQLVPAELREQSKDGQAATTTGSTGQFIGDDEGGDVIKGGGWLCRAVSATTIHVQCRGMLGVELSALTASSIRCCCLSRRRQTDLGQGAQRMGVVANLEDFVRFLPTLSSLQKGESSASGDAPGGRLDFEPGILAQRLTPIWAYLRSYCVLLELYLLTKTRQGSAGGKQSTAKTQAETPPKLVPTSHAEWPSKWVRLEWERPLLRAACGLELATAVVSQGGARDASEAPSKRRKKRHEEEEEEVRVHLRFFHRPLVSSTLPLLPDEQAQQDKAQALLGQFQRFFSEHFESLQSGSGARTAPRTSRLMPVLDLLGAPYLWMLGEAALLLPPLPVVAQPGRSTGSSADAWQTLVEHFALGRVTDARGKECWQLQFVLVRGNEQRRFACSVQATLPLGGWECVWMNDVPLAESLEAAKQEKPPYLLSRLLPLIAPA
ncbi:unnamed protein product [Polarella glacialis]|uniref:Uncharacterized protein n=1 Tax=Polarella glacialis TaxID=89957 RepID=A0A813HSX2_POLGL|nr:unnamed protein product [Polarella glacialis]